MRNEGGIAGHLLSIAPLPDSAWKFRTGKVIYFVGTDSGPIKIGRASDFRARFRQLQCGSSELLHVWAVTPGNHLDEALYHHRFASARLFGEWFSRTPELLDFIDQLRPRFCAGTEGAPTTRRSA